MKNCQDITTFRGIRQTTMFEPFGSFLFSFKKNIIYLIFILYYKLCYYYMKDTLQTALLFIGCGESCGHFFPNLSLTEISVD